MTRSWLRLSSVLAGVCFAAASPARAEMTFVRLTPQQYENTIHSIFGANIQVDANGVEAGFRDEGLLAVGARKLTLSSAGLEHYEAIAQQIAAQLRDPQVAATVFPCKPKASDRADDACAAQVVSQVAPLLFRRTLHDGEVATYVAMARSSTETLKDFYAGLGAALVEMLVAPEFLFRIERGQPDASPSDKLNLDGYSTASRLSFFLWNSAPDKALLAAAQSGKLATPQGRSQQVERLLSSPRAEYGMRAFFTDMLGFDDFATLSKDTALFPKFTKNVEDEAAEQTLRTVVDQLLNKNRDYRDLFTTRETFLTPALAAVYGVPLVRSQELGGAIPWVPYEFPEGNPHVGILTEVSFVALHSHPGITSPTLRGKALRENILCQKVPPPPGNVDFSLVSDTTNPNFKTARQRLTAHRKEAMCAGCHKIMDPVGLALEDFDSSGVMRSTENGAPIDTTGEFNGKPFDGIGQLAAIIKDDPGTTSCLITRAFSYGVGRMPSPDEAAWLTKLQTEMRVTGVRWRDLMRRIAENPAFYTDPAGDMSAGDTKKAEARPGSTAAANGQGG